MSGEPPSTSQGPPPPDASHEEWHEWRHQRRHSYTWGGHWGWFWGLVLIFVGGYALLRTLGLLAWIRGDIFWPLLVIALGAWLIIERALPRQPPR